MLILLAPGAAMAGAFTCSVASVSGISLSYQPGSSTPLIGSGSVTLNCSKSGANLDTVYLELGAGSGINALGAQNRASSGSGYLNYGLWRDAAGTVAWADSQGARLATTVSSTVSTTVTLNWWLVVPARQPVGSGSYLDTVTVRLYQGPSPNPALSDPNPTVATFSMALSVASQCSLSSPPGDLRLSYTSFQSVASTATSSFAVTCTSGSPYTVSLDATGGTLLGLQYMVSLGATGVQTGTGSPQSIAIIGSIAAGQSGSCAATTCAASESRVLTISY